MGKIMSITENESPKVLDQDGYEIKRHGLVLYKEQVWRVCDVQTDELFLRNNNGFEKCKPTDVQWLSEDTISPKPKNGKNKFCVGDFVRRKNGTGRIAKVIEVREANNGTVIKMEYYYDGCYCTGELYASELEMADKPDNWEKMQRKYGTSQLQLSSGHYLDDDGQEFWIGGAGSRGARSWEGWERHQQDSKPKKKEKKDSIERGDLIREEVSRLRSTTDEEPAKKKDPPKIKTRKPKEDW